MKSLTMGGNPISLLGSPVEVGDRAKDFTAVKQDMSPYHYYQETEGKITILSIAPSLDTSTCSLQAQRFNEEAGKLKDEVEVITITVDLPFAQRRFCQDKEIDNVIVVSDYQRHDFGLQYGFLIEGLKLLTRGVIIVDKDRKVRYVQYVEEVSKEPDYDEVLKALEELL